MSGFMKILCLAAIRVDQTLSDEISAGVPFVEVGSVSYARTVIQVHSSRMASARSQ